MTMTRFAPISMTNDLLSVSAMKQMGSCLMKRGAETCMGEVATNADDDAYEAVDCSMIVFM